MLNRFLKPLNGKNTVPKKPIKPGGPAKPKKKIDKTMEEATRPTKRKARPLELTDALAQHIAVMWTHNLTDEIIYHSLGIPHKTFYKWLSDNRLVCVNIRYGDKEEKVFLGFNELKMRMKAYFEPGYLMRLDSIVDKAEDKEDFRTASSNLRWIMSKRLPRKYGREAESRIGSDQLEMVCNAIFAVIFKHVKDPEILGKIQDDFDRIKMEEEQKLDSHYEGSDEADIDAGIREDSDDES